MEPSDEEEGRSREDTRYPLESSYIPWGSVIFVLFPIKRYQSLVTTSELSCLKNKVNVQKDHTSRRLVQTQPCPSGLEVQPAQDIGFRMPGGFGVVVERTSESGVFCGPVEDFIPISGEDSVKRARRISPYPEVEISRRD